MPNKKIAPFGPRLGIGTYETFWDRKRYLALNTAILHNDCIVVDIVQETPGGDYYAEVYHTKRPNDRNMYKMNKQFILHFKKIYPLDDQIIVQMAREVMKANRTPWETRKERDPKSIKRL